MTCSPRRIRHSIAAKSCEKNSRKLESEFEESEIKVPKNLKNKVRAILEKHPDLRWDDALQIVLDETQLDAVRAEKQKAKRKSGDFTGADDEEDDE